MPEAPVPSEDRAIPLVDCREAAWPSVAACRALPAETVVLMARAARAYTTPGLWLADRVSRRWLRRNRTPYFEEVAAAAALVGRPGLYALNASFEWACTTGVAPDRAGGMAMVRVLDWMLDGLGRNVAVMHQAGPAGTWLNLGWPGYAGCLTGLAPGRFAAAINWLPRPGTRLGIAARRRHMRFLGLAADWLADRPGTWRSDAPPPAHLLRQVMETATDYDDALRRLLSEPIAAPAVFTLAGPLPGQGAVIERLRDRAALRPADPVVAAANHWTAMALDAEPNSHASQSRQAAMLDCVGAVADGPLDRLGAPVLSPLTRLVAVLHPADGSCTVQGFEGRRAVTPAWRQ